MTSLPHRPDVLLVTATDVETKALRDCLTSRYRGAVEQQNIDGLIVYHVRGIRDVTVSHTQCEMGNVQASTGLTHTFIQLRPRNVIMLGIAAGILPNIQYIGDIIIATQIRSYEQQRVGDQTTWRSQPYPVSKRLLRIASSVNRDMPYPRSHTGLLLSGEKLVDNQDFVRNLLQKEPNALGLDMESYGLYEAAAETEIPLIVIKAISDFADGNKNHRDKEKYQALAAANATNFVFHMLERFTRSDPQSPPEAWFVQPTQQPQEPPVPALRPGICTLPGGLDHIYWANEIPAGTYPLAAGQASVELMAFRIARYPVTNWQYQQFIADQGYTNKQLWTPQGRVWLKEKERYTSAIASDKPNYPIANVTWYEAMAFCAWLNATYPQGSGWKICLPTEAEWEVAAMWDEKQMRAWVSDDHTPHQNVKEAGHDRTTPVDRYVEGVSPCGALDMAGNVWEWCSSSFTSYTNGGAAIPLTDLSLDSFDAPRRGGAYYVPNQRSGWDARKKERPIMQRHFQGFRVCVRNTNINPR